MSRTHGSFGLTRIEFEQSYRRNCELLNVDYAQKLVELLDTLDPADRFDQRTLLAFGAVLDRFLTESDVGDNAQAPLQIAWRGDGTNG